MRFLPWALAAVFALSTAVLALRGPARADQHGVAAAVPAPAPSASPQPAAVADLVALRRCAARLEAAQDLLARVQASAGARGQAAVAGLPGCAGNAAALAEVEQRISEEVERRLEEIATRRLTERDEHRVAMRKMVQSYLGLTTEESGWLMDYVCSVRGLRADVIDDIRDAKLDLKAAAERQKAEREEALHDIERILGPDKYQQLRSVGGIGKLGDLFECV
jgi:hypothetical protein